MFDRRAVALRVGALIVSSVVLAVGLGAFSSTAGAAPTSLTMESGGPDGGSVSCTGPTTCTAVSDYGVQTLENGAWQPEQSFNGISFGGPTVRLVARHNQLLRRHGLYSSRHIEPLATLLSSRKPTEHGVQCRS